VTSELDEIRTLTNELDEGVREVEVRLERIMQGLGLPWTHRTPARGVGSVIAFVHIPKTAGGTVKSMFAAAYSKRGISTAGNYVRGPERSERKITRREGGWESWYRKGGRVTVGHMPYGVFRKHVPSDTRYMTFLREPVDRVLSHYYRHNQRRDPSRAGVVKARQGRKVRTNTLEEALVELRLPQLNNLATRFLCGHPSPLEELPPSAVDDAKENLRSFAFVGIQERFEESLVLLQRMLGLGSVPYVDRHVSAEDRRPSVAEIPDEQRAMILEHNRLDAELYEFGLRLFEDAVADADERFAADVEALRAGSAEAREAEWREAALTQ
jgi:hypothetical protein